MGLEQKVDALRNLVYPSTQGDDPWHGPPVAVDLDIDLGTTPLSRPTFRLEFSNGTVLSGELCHLSATSPTRTT